MIIRYLETDNFLSHKKESIALPKEGTFLLSGESGAGKSSFIVDAVAYALFGAVATRAKKQSELIRSGADQMSVRITFDLSDIRLTVARGIDKRGSSWSKVWDSEKDEILAEGVAPTGRVIRQYLGGITWQQFYAAFVARQSEIALLTSLRGAERKNLVQRMLGMRELEKAGEIIQARLRRSAAEREQLEKTLGGVDLLAEEKRVEEEGEDLRKQEDSLSQMKNDLGDIEKKKKKAGDQLKPLLEAERLWQSQQKEREKQAALLVELRNAEEKLAAHQKAEKFLLEKEKPDLLAIEEKRDQLRDLFRRSKEYLLLRGKAATLADNSLPGLVESKEQMVSLSKDIEKMNEALSDKRRSLEEIESTGKCSLCKRETGHSHEQIISQLRNETEEIDKEKANRVKEKEKLTKNLPAIEGAEKERQKRESLEARMRDLSEEGIDQDLSSLEREGHRLSSELEKAKELLQEIKLAESKIDNTLEERVEEIRQSIYDISEQQARPEDLERVREDLRELEKEESSLIGQIKGVEELVTSKREALVLQKKQLENLHRELSTLQEKRSRVLELEKLQSYLRAYQKHLAHEIRPALEEVGSEMLQRISGGKHKAMHIDDDYEIEVEDSEGNLLRSTMISGGEAIRANICLRLALTRLVSQRTGVPIAFLVFDEPLPAQDSGHIEKILELLQSLRPFYQQQFIISHVGDLQSNDAIDYVLSFSADKKDKERIHLLAA